ncbi:UNVERIFIED_CONTAM: hypothetical protein GTU68_053702 [Idotea baltica]|nr:hypothetical protein [Idotea baltica]
MRGFKTVLIVDDEPLARERLARLVGKTEGYELIGAAHNAESGSEMVLLKKPDILFLDISMPGKSGLEMARDLLKQDARPAVIFCTAHDEYAVDAFDSCAAGYLVKPVRQESIERALANACRLNQAQLSNLEKAAQAAAPMENEHITVRSHRGVELLPISDISYFQADNKYVTAYHDSGETLLEDSLRKLEERMGELFIRVHRNALVSIAHIEALERGGGEARLRLKGTRKKPSVSRRHLRDVKNLLEHM